MPNQESRADGLWCGQVQKAALVCKNVWFFQVQWAATPSCLTFLSSFFGSFVSILLPTFSLVPDSQGWLGGCLPTGVLVLGCFWSPRSPLGLWQERHAGTEGLPWWPAGVQQACWQSEGCWSVGSWAVPAVSRPLASKDHSVSFSVKNVSFSEARQKFLVLLFRVFFATKYGREMWRVELLERRKKWSIFD